MISFEVELLPICIAFLPFFQPKHILGNYILKRFEYDIFINFYRIL
jgi:hypothetical protein